MKNLTKELLSMHNTTNHEEFNQDILSKKIDAPNYTQIPNLIFDYWLPKLRPNAIVVLMILCRKTFGWHKTTKTISKHQMCKLSGMSKNTIQAAIEELENCGLITKYQTRTEFGFQPNTYSLSVHKPTDTLYVDEKGGVDQNLGGGRSNSDPGVGQILTRGGRSNFDPLLKERDNIKKDSICSTPPKLTHTATPIREKVPQISFSYINQKFEGITENDIKSWKELYNAIDIQLSLKEMEQWVLANPTKAKNKKLWRKFIINWLRQANDKSVNRTAYQQMKQKAPEDDKGQTVRVNKVWIDSIKNKFTNLEDSEIRIEENCVTLVDRSRGLREPIGYAENNFKDIITNFLRKRGVS